MFCYCKEAFHLWVQLLWILSQSRPAGCIHTEVQALWSSCGRHKPKLRIARGRLLLLGAAALSQGCLMWHPCSTMKPLCCTLCGMKKRKVALGCELCSAQGPRLNNPSPCPVPLLHEKCLQFLYTWNFHCLICICFGHQKTSLKPWLCFSRVIFWVYPLVLSLPLWSQTLRRKEAAKNLAGCNSPWKCWLSDPLSDLVRY